MQKSFLINATLVLFLLTLCFGILYLAKPVLMPLAIAGVLTMLFMPISIWLEKKGFGRVWAAIICGLLFALIIAGIIIWAGSQFSNITDNLSLIKHNISHAFNRLQQYFNNSLNISSPDQKKTINQQNDADALGITLTAVMGSLVRIIIYIILILVYLILMLYYRAHFKNFILKLVPETQLNKTKKIINQSAKVMQQYLLGLFIIIAMLWIMYGIGFSIVGIKNALFFAVLCGVLEIIPFVGNITGSTLTSLMALSQGGGLGMVLEVLATYAIVQFIQFYIIAPIIMGAQVKINPLFTIVIIIAGELLWGIPGMILAIPLLAVIKIVFDNVESLNPYGYLIGQDNYRTIFMQGLKKLFHKKNA
ncbi:MAG TPA: AI-2E family transporter [Chitinophagaceae bacterium]|nr:AI-2E family transporter [Chitinophagaceae bacterium]